nr:efflux RND transporter permease subunit [Geopsychrobacter electrodiphilus]
MAAIFVNSRLTPMAIIFSLLLGFMAITLLPREEEPQIKVPMIDVLVSMPGATPSEVEQRVSIPMEKLLYELPGVEYIYSTSMSGQSMLVVRFYVGQNLEEAIVRLNQKLATNFDRIPHGVSPPLIKPHSIDDVPILALTFHGGGYDHSTLRRLAAQVDDEIKSITNVAETKLIGGTRRQVRVEFDPLRLAARNLIPSQLISALQQANTQNYTGKVESLNHEVLLQTGQFLQSAAEIGRIVVGVYGGRPVYLSDVAQIIDGPQEPDTYVLYGEPGKKEEAAVTLSIAKRPGTNAIDVVHDVEAKIESLKGTLIPADLSVSITRNYGKTAADKSNELLLHMGIAVIGVSLLILFFLGFRESLVVMLAIPSTLALSLMVFYLYGYTLNRITLFALIFSIGILVDDAIVVVENIVRHMRLPSARNKSMVTITVEAVAEVGNPTILATLAVIAAILPMAFVGGLMGPYMRPIPIGSSAAMLFSLLIAFTVTPWAAVHLLRRHKSPHKAENKIEVEIEQDLEQTRTWLTRGYYRVMEPLLSSVLAQTVFFAVIIVLLLASCSLVYFGQVKVKMLPFDNKSEFQVILNMPEGSTLEQTSQVALEMGEVVKNDSATTDYQIYVGTSSPYNFNGLVRHYFMRSGSSVADIQVNLLPKEERPLQSHAIAVRIRPALARIAQKYGATVAVAEVPPGPPVLSTLVAEIYGNSDAQRVKLAKEVRKIFNHTKGVVDVDWYRETDRQRLVLKVDKEKAALNGISEGEITRTIQMATQGMSVDLFHQPTDKEEINIILELPIRLRARIDGLLNISLRSARNPQGALVPLRELVTVSQQPVEQPRYRKNLKPVIYVTGDVAGSVESPVYAIFDMNKQLAKLKGTDFGGHNAAIEVFNLHQPFSTAEPSIKWDGEWHITLEVFRDLGLAFAVVMVLIYMLMVGWFKDYFTPLVVMAAIPFSLIGILPAHWGIGAFFTATSMIGFMAGAGIVIRNSIILIDFIELRISHGLPLGEAVIEAGAVRFRPMLLTALAVVVGASVILPDPIFQGLAISLMFGEIASLLISCIAIPVLYSMLKKRGFEKKAQQEQGL